MSTLRSIESLDDLTCMKYNVLTLWIAAFFHFMRVELLLTLGDN